MHLYVQWKNGYTWCHKFAPLRITGWNVQDPVMCVESRRGQLPAVGQGRFRIDSLTCRLIHWFTPANSEA